MKNTNTCCNIVVLALAWSIGTFANAQVPEKPESGPHASASTQKPGVDHTGKPRKGKASYYGNEFRGKKMADGTPMDPNSNAAASKTLPLGTKAQVTNLENGRSAVVEIRDRGPYVGGRIVDVTPKTAEKLGMKKEGVATVEVKPVEMPRASAANSSGK